MLGMDIMIIRSEQQKPNSAYEQFKMFSTSLNVIQV
jgi:hypothetical protein